MKKTFGKFLVAFLFVAVFALAGCNSNSDDESSGYSAYLPSEFSSKTVSALYTAPYSESSGGYEIDATCAVYCFSDSTWVMTQNGVVTDSYGNSENYKVAMYKGTYEIASGNFTNGSLTITQTHTMFNDGWTTSSESPVTATVSGGKMTVHGITFTKQ